MAPDAIVMQQSGQWIVAGSPDAVFSVAAIVRAAIATSATFPSWMQRAVKQDAANSGD
jgi:hypothetical protein